jgi:hypothetical protein
LYFSRAAIPQASARSSCHWSSVVFPSGWSSTTRP